MNTMFISTSEKFVQLKNDPTKDIVDVHPINQEVIAVDMKSKETFEDDLVFQNDIIGAFTTAYARLRLYKAAQVVGLRTCYMDTDSLIFLEKKSRNSLPTGPLLGDLTNEIEQGHHMIDFISSGPKSYSYRLDNGEETVKLKGISLNFTNSMVFNFELMKKIVLGTLTSVKTPLDYQFARVKHRGIVYKRPFTKTYRMTFNKRVIIPGSYVTVPYGYAGLMPTR